jgi:hypothetical protein
MPVYRPRRIGSYYVWQHAVADGCAAPYVLPSHFWDLLSGEYSNDRSTGMKIYRSEQNALDGLRRVFDLLHSQLSDMVIWDRSLGADEGRSTDLQPSSYRASALAKLTPIEREALGV